MTKPGVTHNHHAVVSHALASCSMLPRLALGGGTPRPIKLSADSLRMAAGMARVAATSTGAKALGSKALAKVENHHNFAWRETLPDGTSGIVHRKGATPAQKGVLGIIPGSMTAPGFIVRGRGEALSLNSASHGAGRLMSRRKAMESISKHTLQQFLHDNGVTLLGGNIDEAPMVYKDINVVMQLQNDLIDVIGMFRPKIVRMADE